MPPAGIFVKQRSDHPDLAAFLTEISGFDAVIDVRSPAEFAEDHLPGAVNMPVLSDAERARVGTIYTQESPFVARKIGAALVARNAAAHIEASLMEMGGGWRPLVYCWRGGQRSGSFATILQQIGWRVAVLDGGYRAYRRQVVAALYDRPLPHRMIRLDGNTGSAKTAILTELGALGVQVLDLEGLAAHRGSILGETGAPQPAQKGFESALAQALHGLEPSKVTIIEAESSRIGNLRVPPALWAVMCDAPRLVLSVPVAARAAYLAENYADWGMDVARLEVRLDHLRGLVGHEEVDQWIALARAGDLRALSEALIVRHYDPAYARARRADRGAVLARFEAADLKAVARKRLANQIVAWLASNAG